MYGKIQRRRLGKGEIRVDLGKHLVDNRTFWSSSDVDKIATCLLEYYPEMVSAAANEVWHRTHMDYQVLHLATAKGTTVRQLDLAVKAVVRSVAASAGSRHTGAPLRSA